MGTHWQGTQIFIFPGSNYKYLRKKILLVPCKVWREPQSEGIVSGASSDDSQVGKGSASVLKKKGGDSWVAQLV